MIALHDLQQGTDEWVREKLGKPSASNFKKIVTSTGMPSKSAHDYMLTLAGETLTGQPADQYVSGHMDEGTRREPEARKLYTLKTGSKVTTVGLCYKDEARLCLCSPDGLVGDDGLLEIKNRKMKNHLTYLLTNKVQTTDFIQCQGQMYVTDRTWCDFLSYYPGLPEFIFRIERDESFIMKLHYELAKFTKDLAATITKLYSIGA